MSTDVVPISASPTLATLCTAGVLSAADIHPVSYTHLTLPTTPYV